MNDPQEIKILLVEDSSADAELITRNLRHAQLPFTLRCVDTAGGLIRELGEEPPDVILTDFGLPNFDALEILKLLRERRLEIPLIVLTGTLTDKVAGLLKQGAADYVLRDRLVRLSYAVQRVLAEQKLRGEREPKESTIILWKTLEGDPSPSDFLRECGRQLTNPVLWQKFQERFQKLLFTYLLRGLRYRREPGNMCDLVNDLIQDVYMRLVQNEGQMLKCFRGNTDFSVMAFLARISMSAITDHYRHQTAQKRQAPQVVSSMDQPGNEAAEFNVAAIPFSIDVMRFVDFENDQRHAARNALIFKLHYIDGFTPTAIAAFPGFALSVSEIDAVLPRLKARLRESQ